jgi:phenylpropionate dioxygenase-like ring-hydroxylating dioxygenase large terminal subunit
MFLKNWWYVAAIPEEVGEGVLNRWILNEPVIMYRTEAGKPVAMLDMCPHRSYPLSKGTRLGDRIRCNYHGLEFEPDGKCAHIPGQKNIAPRCRATTFPVVEKWRWLWIWMGDPKLADESKIPDMHWNDDPEWIPTGGRFDIDCNYQLLVDNLMDLSHETFVHASTIGNAAVAETPSSTTVDGMHVRTYRQMIDCAAPPLYVKLRGFVENIDRTQDVNFTPPSNIVIKSKSVPHGSDPAAPAMALEYRVLNAITPSTEKSCYHFWSVPRNFAPDPAVTKAFHEGSVRAFTEDIDVLESQQKMVDRLAPGARWIDINADSGGLAARRVISRLMEEERAS